MSCSPSLLPSVGRRPASSVLRPPFLIALRVKNGAALTCPFTRPSPPLADPWRQRLDPVTFFSLPTREPGVESVSNCVLWRRICAKEIASYLVGVFPCLGPKAKVGRCARERPRRCQGTKGRVCVLGWGGHGRSVFVNPQPTHRDNGFCH